MSTRLLVAHVHHLEAFLHAAVVDGQDVSATEREDVLRAGLLERPRHQVSAGQIAHVRGSSRCGTCTTSSFSRSGSSKKTA